MPSNHILNNREKKMPRITQETIKYAQVLLKKAKVFTIDQVVDYLSCSIPTARLKLKQWNVYTSYNQNGRYYTFYNVPDFDQFDIWCFNGICFSKHGNLKKTIISLVSSSKEGLSGKQLGRILKLVPQSFLHHFKSTPGIRREKHEGVYVHFSDKQKIYQNQVTLRAKRKKAIINHQLSNEDAIIVLTSIIKHHCIKLENIMELPEIMKRKISRNSIYDFMEAHDLLKKTSD